MGLSARRRPRRRPDHARRAGGGLMRILLVEDDRTLLRTLAIALRAEGHEVLTAADGRTALAAVADAARAGGPRPRPPGPLGMDVLRSVRGWSRLPVVVLSAPVRLLGQGRSADAGADDYVTKPFGLEELLARIRAARRRRLRLPPVVAGDLVVRPRPRASLVRGRSSISPRSGPPRGAAADRGRAGHARDPPRTRSGARRTGARGNYLRTFLGTLRKSLRPTPRSRGTCSPSPVSATGSSPTDR